MFNRVFSEINHPFCGFPIIFGLTPMELVQLDRGMNFHYRMGGLMLLTNAGFLGIFVAF